MPDKERRSFEDRVRSGEGAVSWINEPLDFTVDFAVEQPKAETATARALRIWFKQLEGEKH
jgi:hypothetical protein